MKNFTVCLSALVALLFSSFHAQGQISPPFYNPANVRITGGTITGTPISEASGSFTTLAASGQTNLDAGTVAAPGLVLEGELGTGLYRIGANRHGYAVSGVKVLDIVSTGLAVTGTLNASGMLTVPVDATDPNTSNTASIKVGTNSSTGYSGLFFLGSTSYNSYFGRVPSSLSGVNDAVAYTTGAGGGSTIRVLFSSAGLGVTGTLSSTGITSVTDATDATSTTAASLKTAGGLGIAKSAFIGNSLGIGSGAVLNRLLNVYGATNSFQSFQSGNTGTGITDGMLVGITASNVMQFYNYENAGYTFLVNDGTLVLSLDSGTAAVTGTFSSTAPAKLSSGYTVASLPAGTVGQRAYVTDALAPTFGATVVGGGAVVIPVFYNGTNWIVG